MLHDKRPSRRPIARHRQAWRKRNKLLSIGTLILSCFLIGLWFGSMDRQDEAPATPTVDPVAAPAPPAIDRKLVKGTIQPGDTITALLGDIFSARQIYDLNQSSKTVFPLSKLCAGQAYQLCLVDGRFESFVYDIDKEEQLVIEKNAEDFSVTRVPIEYRVRTDLVTGIIESSLFEAIVASKESEVLAISLADIFAWDIDFIRDIQAGDTFEALVEKRFREGRPAGYGRILAARFTNQGQVFNAYLFKDGNQRAAYYDENGRSVRKAFLKAPLSFSRISSGFNMRRLHPITKRVSPHPAIDYAAPTGTPIKTVGDGVITFSAYKRYNGNCVKIRHPGGWETMYNHMSRFGRGIKRGIKVRQGQIIGYVGTTGRSTGPHLDFRMYKNGVAINPLKVKSPPSAPVSPQHMPHFKQAVAGLAARLDNREMIQTAHFDSRITGPDDTALPN